MSILVQQYRTVRKASFVGAMDAYTSNLWALRWTKRLLASYAGPLIRIRRSSDNAETDIGAKANGSLDDTALLAFCGSDTGYVTTMYDQSGNSRNLTQTTTGNQPTICASGAMSGAVGEHHGIWFPAASLTQFHFLDSNPSALTSIEIFGAIRSAADPAAAAASSGHPFTYQPVPPSTSSDSHWPWTDGIIYDKFGSSLRKVAGNPSNALTTAHMCNILSAPSNWRLYAGGHTYTTATNTVLIHTAPRVGSTLTADYNFRGYLTGNVIYSAAQSSRSTIRGILLSGSG